LAASRDTIVGALWSNARSALRSTHARWASVPLRRANTRIRWLFRRPPRPARTAAPTRPKPRARRHPEDPRNHRENRRQPRVARGLLKWPRALLRRGAPCTD